MELNLSVKNTTHTYRNHKSWSHDAIVIMFAHMKMTWKDLSLKSKARMHTKPNMPHLCAVLKYSESTFVVNDDSPQLRFHLQKKAKLKIEWNDPFEFDPDEDNLF
jgi:hypothetical protein